MRAIVSSRYAVEIVDFDLGKVVQTVRTAPYEYLYYGITWNAEYMFLARRDLAYGTRCAIEILDKDLEYVDTMLHGHSSLNDVHQIQWYEDALWITSSGINGVTRMTMDGYTTVYYPNKEVRGHDVNHFNSIMFRGDSMILVAHNGGASQIWAMNMYTLDHLSISDPLGMGAHNLAWSTDGKMYTLDSKHGRMVTHGCTIDLKFNKYPRGLAVSNKFVAIGRSEHETDRSKRHIERKGAIQLYNINEDFGNITFSKQVELNHGQVYEVRFLNLLDYAHVMLPDSPRSSIRWHGKWS